MKLTELQERAFAHALARITSKYPFHMSKREACLALDIKPTPFEKMMKLGTSPRFKKLGMEKQSTVRFTAYDVAMFDSLGVTMNDYLTKVKDD